MRLAALSLAALLAGGCSDLPTSSEPAAIAGIYPLVSIDGEALPEDGTTSGELRLGFDSAFILELCDSDPPCTILEGTASRTGNRLRFVVRDSVLEAMIEGTRITSEIDGAVYVFEQYMPAE